MSRIGRCTGVGIAVCVFGLAMGSGCPTGLPLPSGGTGPYNNTTDRTNNNAKFLRSEACRACHPDKDAQQIVHGHAQKLKRIQGAPPSYPPEGTRAGVPNPPDGFGWDDIAYVIGGYIRKGRFVDQNGYVMTNDAVGVDTQWNLDFGPSGVSAGFVPYENHGKFSPENPKPYNFDCFVCHTTGPLSVEENGGLNQDGKPAHAGTWVEEGVQCEACHGPGSNHVPNPSARNLFVDTSARFCGECHNRPFNADGSVILASGGFIKHHEQYPELLASGGHATLDCTTCHDPHISTNYDRANAIRQECTDCHPGHDMALHKGKVLARGDYTETLGCESCHMPYATKSAAVAAFTVSGGRAADMRTHIFRISTVASDYTAMFTSDLGEVRKDAEGKAAVTLDFVCQRCHNGSGNAFALTLEAASAIASGMHDIPD